MPSMLWMLVMPGVFLAIAVVYYVVSAAVLVGGTLLRAARRHWPSRQGFAEASLANPPAASE